MAEFPDILDTLKRGGGAPGRRGSLCARRRPRLLGTWRVRDRARHRLHGQARGRRAGPRRTGESGFQAEKPPENWLYKAYDGDVLIDLIFDPKGGPIDDDVLARAEELEVDAVRMSVMTLDDVMVTKLLALREHEVDYDGVLEVARSLREQIDWANVRERTDSSPYARGFFFLAEELEILPPENP